MSEREIECWEKSNPAERKREERRENNAINSGHLVP
jgi:hypothetical protein